MEGKIYTKTGDSGETGLFGGKRVGKDDLRIEAYGTVDELNANLGLLRDHLGTHDQQELLYQIQCKLFTIGSNLAIDPTQNIELPGVVSQDILALETAIDKIQLNLPPLKNFILPGGDLTVSHCHLARCVCRRAERRIVSLSKQSSVDQAIIQYLNRLSDYLFVLARKIGHDFGIEEIKWNT